MGWLRANILYDQGPQPRMGSYQEVVHIIVFEARQAAALAETRAVAQASLGGKKAVEAFDKYRELLNAPTEAAKKQEMQKALESVGTMGPIRFRSMLKAKTRSVPTVSREDTQ